MYQIVPFYRNCIIIPNISPFLFSLAALDSFPPGEAILRPAGARGARGAQPRNIGTVR